MTDTPSPLALARERRNDAVLALMEACAKAQKGAGTIQAVSAATTALTAAEQALSEALVEATLRWREESGYLFRVRNGALEYLDPNDRGYYAGAWGRFSPAIHLIAIEATRV